MSDQALIDDQNRLTAAREAQAEQANEGARKAPAQSPSDFIGNVRTAPEQIPVKQTVPVPSKRK